MNTNSNQNINKSEQMPYNSRVLTNQEAWLRNRTRTNISALALLGLNISIC